MDCRSFSIAQKMSALVSSSTQENREPVDALVSDSKATLEAEGVKSSSAHGTSASKLRRALHCIDSNRPRPTLTSTRHSRLKVPSRSSADQSVHKRTRGEAVSAKASKEPNKSTERLLAGLKRPAVVADDKTKDPMGFEAQVADQDSENLAWMDMMLALLEKRYGSYSSLPVCLTDLEAANLYQLPLNKRLKTEITPLESRSSLDATGTTHDSEMAVVSATNSLETPANLNDEQEIKKEIKRQRVLLRLAQQIQASSVSSSTSCGCKTGCLKMYCMCFSSRGFCHSGCNCDDCKNRRKYQTGRIEAIQNYLSNDPRAFSFALLSQDTSTSDFLHLLPQKSSAVVLRGCRCKKSKCLKKYCECFQNGIACTSHCRCVECSNHSESKVAHQHSHLHKRSAQSGSCVSSAPSAQPFHPVQITVTKQPRRNHVGKTLRLKL